MELSELQRSSWQTSEEHGFHQAQLDLPPKSLATYLKLFLTIGELVEAGEELRAGRHMEDIYYKHVRIDPDGFTHIEENSFPWCLETIDPEERWPTRTYHHERFDVTGPYECQWIPGKPEGFPIELSDALIRLCDLAEDVSVDLEHATAIKAAYNRTREFLHGKTA